MIEKIRYRFVYNRKNKLNNQGTALVQIEAYLNRRKIYISTNLYLRPAEWDKRKSQVVDHPHSDSLNAMLYEKILELQAIEIGYWKRGISPSLLDLKNAVKHHVSADITFLTFARNNVEHSDRKEGTKQNMYATIHRIKDFRGDVEIRDVNYKYLTEFESYLRSIGLKVNSVGKHLRNVRTLINEAINQGYMSLNDYPFRKFRIQKEKPEHRVLTQSELSKMEKTVLKGKMKQRVLDSFLFCCYSGLRFSDYKQLTSDNIFSKNGKIWLSFQSQKTSIKQKIPIYLLFDGKAINLIGEYESIEHMNKIGCNADVNRILKEITAKAGIKKRVTFHTARHTFATLLLSQSIPITTIQKLLWHTSVKTTQIYSEVIDDTLISDLKKASKNNKSRFQVESDMFYPKSTDVKM